MRRVPGVMVMTLVVVTACSDAGEESAAPCPALPAVAGADGSTAEVYSGPLFDAGGHDDLDRRPQRLACLMDQTGVDHALVGTVLDPDAVVPSEQRYREAVADQEARFRALFRVEPSSRQELEVTDLERILSVSGLLLVGFGPIDFTGDPWAGTSLQDAPWPRLLELLAERDTLLVLRLRADQRQELSAVLDRHPEVRVAVWAADLGTAASDLLRRHPGLFVVLDSTAIVNAGDASGLAEAETSSEFVAAYPGWDDASRRRARERWLPVVQAAPRRVLWAMDLSSEWRAEPAVYSRSVAMSRAFLLELPRPLRAGIAIDNARRIFAVPTPPAVDA